MIEDFWFIFGEHPDGTSVDIAWSDGDVLTCVPRDLAEHIIQTHNDSLEHAR